LPSSLNYFLKKLSLKSNLLFIIKISGLFALCSFLFSLIGLDMLNFINFGFSLPSSYIVGNPLEVSGISLEHLLGHVSWGLVVGIATFSIRYVILGGLFPLALDADHLIQFLDLEMVPRFSHSILFAIAIFVIFYFLFGKKDIRLPVLASVSVFAHISFDILLGGTSQFPFLIPFVGEMIQFDGFSWIIFESLSIIPVFLISIFYLKQRNNFSANLK
jgi:hypothetical protein